MLILVKMIPVILHTYEDLPGELLVAETSIYRCWCPNCYIVYICIFQDKFIYEVKNVVCPELGTLQDQVSFLKQ
jgi:hypothetical protein